MLHLLMISNTKLNQKKQKTFIDNKWTINLTRIKNKFINEQ